MAKDFKGAIKQGKQAEQPATPLATSTQGQAVQPQEEVKVVPIASSEVNVTPDKVNDIFEKQRESLSEVKKDGYDGIFQQIQANNNATAKQKMAEMEEKRRNRARIFNAIGDGVAALSNLYFASQGAPSVKYDPRGSLSARAQERWDKMDLLRNQEEQKQYLRDLQKHEMELRKAREERLAYENTMAEAARIRALEDRRERDEAARQYEARKLADKFERDQQKLATSHKNTLEQINARGGNASKLEEQRQNNRVENRQAKQSANKPKDEAAKATAEAFYSLPEDVQNQIRESYGKYGDNEELTIKQMEEALIKYNAKKKPKKQLSTYAEGVKNTKSKQIENF